MKRKKSSGPWLTLAELIEAYAAAAVADSWKGGGDPVDVGVLELAVQLARAKVYAHIERMKREAE